MTQHMVLSLKLPEPSVLWDCNVFFRKANGILRVITLLFQQQKGQASRKDISPLTEKVPFIALYSAPQCRDPEPNLSHSIHPTARSQHYGESLLGKQEAEAGWKPGILHQTHCGARLGMHSQ